MGAVEQKRRVGASVDAEVIAAIEERSLEAYLSYLSSADSAAVRFARFRTDTLKAISEQESMGDRLSLWGRIEETDREHASNEVYERAVWVLEKMSPPLEDGDRGTGQVVLFFTEKGTSYANDQMGKVRQKVTANKPRRIV